VERKVAQSGIATFPFSASFRPARCWSAARSLALGRKAGADYVLFGSFTRFGQGASLDVRCAPVSEEKQRETSREIFVHSGSIGETVSPTALAPGGTPFSGGSLSGSSLKDLEFRIEALEAALTELLEADSGSLIETEAVEELP